MSKITRLNPPPPVAEIDYTPCAKCANLIDGICQESGVEPDQAVSGVCEFFFPNASYCRECQQFPEGMR